MPSSVEIIRSENSELEGQIAKVTNIRLDKGEVDYRVVTLGGDELWIPSEYTDVIF